MRLFLKTCFFTMTGAVMAVGLVLWLSWPWWGKAILLAIGFLGGSFLDASNSGKR
jgi:hypothetical protein